MKEEKKYLHLKELLEQNDIIILKVNSVVKGTVKEGKLGGTNYYSLYTNNGILTLFDGTIGYSQFEKDSELREGGNIRLTKVLGKNGFYYGSFSKN